MLNTELRKVARDRIGLEFEEQDRQLDRAIGEKLSGFMKRGTLQSSMAARAVGELYGNDMRVRGETSLACLLSVCSTFGVTPEGDLRSELESFLSKELAEQKTQKEQQLQNQAPIKGASPSMWEIASTEFESGYDIATRKLRSDLDLYVAVLNRPQSLTDSSTANVTVHGNVGVVQTGAYASSSISIDATARGEITAALEVLAAALAEMQEGQGFNKSEIVELIDESKAELAKDKPNVSRLRGLLPSIALAIQTSAALRPAYEILKRALALMGITGL
jgi:hypothetical protein